MRSDMDRHGITAALSETQIFATLHEAIAAAHDGTLGLGVVRREARS